MARTLAVVVAFTMSLPLGAVPRPKMDMCSMRSLVAEDSAFRATWTRENEFADPVENVVMSATFSPAGRILTPPTRLTPPKVVLPENHPRSVESEFDDLGRKRFKDHFLTIRWAHQEVVATVRDVDGSLRSETRLTSTDFGPPPEFVIGDAGEEGVIAWLQREPKSWTTNVRAAMVKRDGVVELRAEPVLTAAKGIKRIAIAWNGHHYILAGIFERSPDTPETEKLFVMRLDPSMRPAGRTPRTVPGTKSSYPTELFLAVLGETVALGWDEASPHIAIIPKDGQVSAPIDLHPKACRATQFR